MAIKKPDIVSTRENLHDVTLNWLKKWYHLKIKPFSTKYKINSLNQFHFPTYSSDVTYFKNLVGNTKHEVMINEGTFRIFIYNPLKHFSITTIKGLPGR